MRLAPLAVSAVFLASSLLCQAQTGFVRTLTIQGDSGRAVIEASPGSGSYVFYLPSTGGTLLTSTSPLLNGVGYGQTGIQSTAPPSTYLFNVAYDTTVAGPSAALGARISSQSKGGGSASGLQVASIGSGAGASTALSLRATGSTAPGGNIALDIQSGSMVIRSLSSAGLVVNDANGRLTTLAPGAANEFLTVGNGGPEWSTAPRIVRYDPSNGVDSTDSDTYVDASQMSFQVDSGKVYDFEALIGVRRSGAAAADVEIQWNPQAGITMHYLRQPHNPPDTITIGHTNASDVTLPTNNDNTGRFFALRGFVSASTTGTVQMRFRRKAGGTGFVYIKPESYIKTITN